MIVLTAVKMGHQTHIRIIWFYKRIANAVSSAIIMHRMTTCRCIYDDCAVCGV